jgi:hypothetical protein
LADESSAVTTAAPPQATNAATPGVRATAASLEPSLPASRLHTLEKSGFVRGLRFAADQCDSYARKLRGPMDDIEPELREATALVFGQQAEVAEFLARTLRDSVKDWPA